MDAGGGAAAQRLGVEVMTALVGEFSLSSASPMGMSWELHEACCRDMEVCGVYNQKHTTRLSVGGQGQGLGLGIESRDMAISSCRLCALSGEGVSGTGFAVGCR